MAAGAAPARRNSPREWALAIGGGLALAAGLVWLLRGPGPAEPAEPGPQPTITAPPVVAPAPASPPVATATPPADLALAGLRTGPDGGMAIIVAGGRQYLLRPGRSLPGGLRLLRVEPQGAILAGPAGEQLLAFPNAPLASPSPQGARPQPPGGDPTPWRLALAPQRSAQGLAGWRLTSVAGLPLLARAGLKPGDILLSANGAELISEEKVMELPQELAANGQLVLRVRRGVQLTEITVKP